MLEVAGAGDLATGTAVPGIAWFAQRRRVEQVEDVGTELGALFVIGFEILEDRHVDALIAGPRDDIAAAAQVRKRRCCISDVARQRASIQRIRE